MSIVWWVVTQIKTQQHNVNYCSWFKNTQNWWICFADTHKTPGCLNCESTESSAYNVINLELKILLFFPVKYPRNWYRNEDEKKE